MRKIVILIFIILIGINGYFIVNRYKTIQTNTVLDSSIIAPLPINQLLEAVEKYGNDFISFKALNSEFLDFSKLTIEHLNTIAGVTPEFYQLLTENFSVMSLYADKYYNNMGNTDRDYLVQGFLGITEEVLQRLSIHELVIIANLSGETLKNNLVSANYFRTLEFDLIHKILAEKINTTKLPLEELNFIHEGVQSTLDLFGELEADTSLNRFSLILLPTTINNMVMDRIMAMDEMKTALNTEILKFKKSGLSFDLDRLLVSVTNVKWLHENDLTYIIDGNSVSTIPSGVYNVVKYNKVTSKQYRVNEYSISHSIVRDAWIPSSYSLINSILTINYGRYSQSSIILQLDRDTYYLGGESLRKAVA